jgi:hypothetical protein
MPFAAAAAVATVGAAYMGKKASDKAAAAQQHAADASIAEQQAARNEYQHNIAPYMQAGTGALGTINALNAGDFSSFQQSPDYQFRFDQGMQGLDRSAAARGAVNAGGTDADRIAYGQGMASQGFNDFYNRQYNLAAMGQNAIAGQGSMAQSTAGNIGNLLTGAANAQGNAAINGANAWGNAAAGLSGLAGQYMGGRQSAYNFGGGGLTGGGLSGGYGSTGGYTGLFGPQQQTGGVFSPNGPGS